MSGNHDGYESAMKDVLGILDAHGLLARESGFDAVRIAVGRLRETNRELMREIEEDRCESTILHGFESRSFRCARRSGHGGEHAATVSWSDGTFGTATVEEEREHG